MDGQVYYIYFFLLWILEFVPSGCIMTSTVFMEQAFLLVFPFFFLILFFLLFFLLPLFFFFFHLLSPLDIQKTKGKKDPELPETQARRCHDDTIPPDSDSSESLEVDFVHEEDLGATSLPVPLA